MMNHWLSAPRSTKRLKAVAMLDLDPNKPENSPPGQISLTVFRKPILEPPFARPLAKQGYYRLVRAHAIGFDGYKENSAHYMNAVVDLIEHYRTLIKDDSLELNGTTKCPLVVLCPAWHQGSGVDLNVGLMRTIKPSRIFCLGEGSPKAMDALQGAAGGTQIQVIQPQPQPSSRAARTPSELREMQLLSYFHSEAEFNEVTIWNSTPLSSRRPYQVSYSAERCDLAGIFIFGEVPVMYPNMLSTLLNGSLVSLVAVEDESVFEDTEVCRGHGDNIPYFTAGPKGYTDPFDPRKSSVFGVALVRGINSAEQTFQVLTPVPPETIANIAHKRLVLTFGSLECPGWAYTEEHYYRGGIKNKRKKQALTDETSPWVEEADDDEGKKQLSGPAMQAWKTRRFH
jgi:polynucleotide 5'-hydroxyl-kinase GRC3/NOL9